MFQIKDKISEVCSVMECAELELNVLEKKLKTVDTKIRNTIVFLEKNLEHISKINEHDVNTK